MSKKDNLVYRAVYGYQPGQWYQIPEEELEKVIYAHRYQKVITIGGIQINGRHIQRIEPDIHYYTGWNRAYIPTNADDERQVAQLSPIKKLEERQRLAGERVSAAVETGRVELLKEPEKIALPAKE